MKYNVIQKVMKSSQTELMTNRPKLFRTALFCVLSFAEAVIREATEQSDLRILRIKALL